MLEGMGRLRSFLERKNPERNIKKEKIYLGRLGKYAKGYQPAGEYVRLSLGFCPSLLIAPTQILHDMSMLLLEAIAIHLDGRNRNICLL